MSRRPLALQAYLAYARGQGGTAAPPPEGVPGKTVLLIGQGRDNGRALHGLAIRLRHAQPELDLWVAGDVPVSQGIRSASLPPDRPGDCARFAAALRPVLVIWAGDVLHPALIEALDEVGAELSLVNLGPGGLRTLAPRWIPDPLLGTLTLFRMIYAIDSASARPIRRIGMDPARLRVSGPLTDSSVPLDVDEALRDEMASVLAGRPVWLAAHIHEDEALSVIRAHRQAVRLAHRLLLVAVPESPAGFAALCTACEDAQMRVCTWDDGAMPDENTQVLLTETPDELGLWYRLAPLAFMGQSLVIGASGRDPFEAASLGAAVLYGPNVGNWLDSYSRLISAGAARIVRDAESLGAAVTHLVAPDQAASMAIAGWQVVSEGAELADELIAMVSARFDETEMA